MDKQVGQSMKLCPQSRFDWTAGITPCHSVATVARECRFRIIGSLPFEIKRAALAWAAQSMKDSVEFVLRVMLSPTVKASQDKG